MRLSGSSQGHPSGSSIRLARPACRNRFHEVKHVGYLETLQSIFCPFAQVAFAQISVTSDDHQVKALPQSLVRHADGERGKNSLVLREQIFDLQWSDLVPATRDDVF